MASEQELLARIEMLEQENSELRDKLDMIYAIVAPDDEQEEHARDDRDIDEGLVQIRNVN